MGNKKDRNDKNRKSGKENSGDNNGKEKFYFFRVDKDKIKLHLKEIGSKFISKKRRRKKVVLVISIFMLIGIGIAIYTNTDNDNMENYNPGSENIIEEAETGEEELTETEETIFFGEDDLELDEEETGRKNEEDNTSETIRDSSSVVVDDTEEQASSAATDRDSETEASAETEAEEISEEENTDRSQNEREKEDEGVVTESTSELRETTDTSDNSVLRPVSGEVIQESGWFYHQIFEDWRFQNGITLEGESGDIVMAADSGTVVSVKEDEYRGIMVEIDHGNSWSSFYGHLRRASVSPDEVVGKGQEVGLIGESGIVDQPCLYFELLNEEGPVDPLEYFE